MAASGTSGSADGGTVSELTEDTCTAVSAPSMATTLSWDPHVTETVVGAVKVPTSWSTIASPGRSGPMVGAGVGATTVRSPVLRKQATSPNSVAKLISAALAEIA